MSTHAIASRIPFAGVLGLEVVSATKERIEARMLVRPSSAIQWVACMAGRPCHWPIRWAPWAPR